MTVTDGVTGQPVDPYSINTYSLVSAGGAGRENAALQRNAFASLRREFAWRVPVTLKVGLDANQSARDVRGGNPAFTFVGADGRAGTADDAAAVVLDEAFSERTPPFGFPRTQRVSTYQLLDLYKAKPASPITPAASASFRVITASQRATSI